MSLEKWKILASDLALDHRWCTVRRDVVELPDGTVVDDYFVVVRPDVALVLPITADQEIIFVRQYRHGAQKILLELPAGTFDPTVEAPDAAALRELQEETGYTADRLQPLGTIYDNPVKDTNQIHLFHAPNAYPVSNQALDITEEIRVVKIPAATVMSYILSGEICVAGSLTALLLWREQIQSSEH